MHTNADFLAAVAAEPTSALTRLVYADWLDEQNDPRAELIRHEEQMREWPPFADEYWQAKPQRAELCRTFDPEWVRALGYGTSVPPLFRHGLPDDLRQRWRLIREAYELCTDVSMADVGEDPEVVAAAERALGERLPESVAHFVSFAREQLRHDSPPPFAGVTDFTAQQDLEFVWLFEVDPGGDHLCVRRSDWHLADPPVVAAPPIDGDPETGLVFDTPDTPPTPLGTLSEYVLSFLLTRYHGTAGEWGDRVTADVARTRLTEWFGPPVGVAFLNGYEEEVFEAVNVLIRLQPADDGTAFLRVSVRAGGAGLLCDLLDFPPTPDGYRGGAFLPQGFAELGSTERMSNPWVADRADDLAREAFDEGRANADLQSAERWARLAAEYGDAGSARFLYLSHQKGRFRLSGEDEFRYLLQAAETSEPLFACLVAYHYRDGNAVAKDPEAAARWFRRAAEADYATGWYCLGMLYVDGIGVPQDREEAIRCLEKAAALGDPDSHGMLVALRAGRRADRVLDTTGGATSRLFAPPGRNSERPDKPNKLNRRRK